MIRSRLLLWIALMAILLCLTLPGASAAPTRTTATPSPTVPPVLQACSHAANPVAAFSCDFPDNTSNPVPDGPPYTIRCYDKSTTQFNQSIISWKWDFGDGGSSNDANPRHTYSDASRYDIRLTVTTFCGPQFANTSVVSLPVYCSIPQPAFTTNVSEGPAPLAVAVTDGSLRADTLVTRWVYWFDNTHSSTDRNPVHVYTAPGTYLINQTVWKDCVQLGSTYPPATRQIRVLPPGTPAPANATTAPRATPQASPPLAGATPSLPLPATTAVPGTPSPAGKGSLSVNAEPAGAQVWVDNVLRGTSPVTVPDLSAGSHTLRIEKEGYYNMSMPVGITAGKTTELSTSLMSSGGSTGIALLPVIALALIVLCVLGAGAYLYLKQRAESLED